MEWTRPRVWFVVVFRVTHTRQWSALVDTSGCRRKTLFIFSLEFALIFFSSHHYFLRFSRMNTRSTLWSQSMDSFGWFHHYRYFILMPRNLEASSYWLLCPRSRANGLCSCVYKCFKRSWISWIGLYKSSFSTMRRFFFSEVIFIDRIIITVTPSTTKTTPPTTRILFDLWWVVVALIPHGVSRLEKDIDDREKREACTYIKKSVAGSRAQQLMSAFNDPKAEKVLRVGRNIWDLDCLVAGVVDLA